MLCGTHVAGRYVADTYVGASCRHDGVEVAAKDMILLADEVHQVHPGRPGADCPPRLSMFGRGGGIWRKVLAVMSLDGELAVLTHPARLVEQVCVFPNLAVPPLLVPPQEHPPGVAGSIPAMPATLPFPDRLSKPPPRPLPRKDVPEGEKEAVARNPRFGKMTRYLQRRCGCAWTSRSTR